MKDKKDISVASSSSSLLKLSGVAIAISLAAIPLVLGILDSQFDVPFTWQNALLLFAGIWCACFWYFRKNGN